MTAPARALRRHPAILALLLGGLAGLYPHPLTASPLAQGGSQSARGEPQAGRLLLEIRDASDGALVPRVVVEPDEGPVRVAEQGTLELELPAGSRRLELSARGYARLEIRIEMQPGALRRIDVELRRLTVSEQVQVVAPPEDEGEGGRAVESEQVLRVAGALDNVFRVLQTLPGVAAPEDFSGRLSVRGGGPDQNLTVLDGVEVHNPYRLFGLVSAFNPETVERFELTAGGFGADRGDRLSSLLVVDTRPGAPTFGGSSTLSVTDANLLFEGGWGTGRRWLGTARRTYYDLVAERISDSDFPSFEDLQLRLDAPFAGGLLVGTGLRSRESADLDIEDDAERDRVSALTAADNDVYALRWTGAPLPGVVATTSLARYRNLEGIDFDGSFRAELRRANVPGDDAFGRLDVVFEREIEVRDLSVRQALSVDGGPGHLLGVGLEFHDLDTATRFATTGDRNPQAANGSSVRGGAGLPDRLSSSVSGSRGGVWLEDEMSLGARWSLTPGLRYDWSTLNGDRTLSPRLAAVFRLSDRERLRFGGGLYTQSPGYEKLLQSDTFIDLTDMRRLGVGHQRSWHAILGYRREMGGGMSLEAEAWLKSFDDLVVGALESEPERLARIARYDFPAELSDQVPAAPIITSRPTNGGAGRAGGLDLFLVRRPRAARDLFGWLAYSYGRSEQEAYGRRFPFEYDRRHALSLVAGWRPTRRWEVGGTFRWASGFPRTPPVGVRVDSVAAGEGSDRLVPAVDPDGNPIWIVDYGDVSNLNSGRLPSYARLDARVTYRPGGLQGRWEVYLEVLNVLGRTNAGSLEPSLLYDPTGPRPRIVEDPDGSLPRLPSFGVRFRF